MLLYFDLRLDHFDALQPNDQMVLDLALQL